MIRFIYTLFILLICLPIWAQNADALRDLTSGKYIVDNQSEIDFNLFDQVPVWKLEELQGDETLDVVNSKSQNINLPFIGMTYRNGSGAIYQLGVTDPLMEYGTQRVILQRPIDTQSPERETISTGYTIVFTPDEIDDNALNQLSIRPDSIRVTVRVKISDSPWSDTSIKYKSYNLDNRSFLRQMEINRSVEVKVEPFGWTPVNSIAPMIDWDGSYTVEHRYFIANGLNIPYAIVDKRDDNISISIYDFNPIGTKAKVISGAPEIKAVPNPVINDVRFEISNVPKGIYLIKIKNILGEIKIQKSVQLSTTDIFPVNIDELRKGSYFYVLEDEQGNVLSTKRLIVLKP